LPSTLPEPFKDLLSNEVSVVTKRSLDKFPVRVFLCGSAVKNPRSRSGRARRKDIRIFIKSKLKSEMKQCEVTLGEHKNTTRAYAEAIGRRAFNLADHEFALVKNHMDLVIIFPCSPGSFAELGMFCLVEDVAGKLWIIVDREQKTSKGYVMLGPVKAAEQNNAKVVYVDYKHRDNVWKEIKELVLEVKARKRKRRLLGVKKNVRG